MTLRKSTKYWLSVLAVSAVALVIDGGARDRLGGWSVPFLLAGLTALSVLAARAVAVAFRHIVRRLTLRLAFSYFLIGIVPIPLLALLLFCGAYLVAHQYAATRLRREITAVGEGALRSASNLPELRADPDGRVAASPLEWIPAGAAAPWLLALERPGLLVHDREIFLAVPTGAPRAARVLRLDDPAGGWLQQLADRTGYTVGLTAGESRRREGGIRIRTERPARRDPQPGRAYRPRAAPPAGIGLWEGEWLRAFYIETAANAAEERVETGENVVILTAKTSPKAIADQLFSQGVAQIGRLFFVALIAVAGALLFVYLVALAIAFILVGTITRNVNRLTRAAAAISRGDFSARVNSRSRDQIGDLARAFDAMAASIERLLAETAEKERLKAEIGVARTIHQKLLPPLRVERPGFAALASFEPLAEIGGDYYDFLPMADGRTAVAVGDVSGHGLSTGLVVAMSKAALSILLESGASGPALFSRLNDLIRRSTEAHSSMTLALFAYEPSTRTGELTNAGQLAPYRVNGDGARPLELPSFPLGLSGRGGFPTRRYAFAPGDRLVFFTDGLVEATDPAGEPFGFERFEAVLSARRGEPADAIRDALLAAVAAHAGGAPPEDDRTLVVLTLE